MRSKKCQYLAVPGEHGVGVGTEPNDLDGEPAVGVRVGESVTTTVLPDVGGLERKSKKKQNGGYS